MNKYLLALVTALMLPLSAVAIEIGNTGISVDNEIEAVWSVDNEDYDLTLESGVTVPVWIMSANINADFDYINKCENKDLVNQISMICPFEPEEKQMLLESKCIENRYILLISILEDNLNLENKTNVIKH